MKRRTYLMVNPQHPYAVEIIRRIDARHGIKPVCIYTNRRAEFYARSQYPQLQDWALDSYFSEGVSPRRVASELHAVYDIVGMAPHCETTMLPAAALLEYLPTGWNSAAILRRFSDKFAFKNMLRQRYPWIAVGESRVVRRAEDVFRDAVPDEFVIKPNTGHSNRTIGFFDRNNGREPVDAYFAAAGPGEYVLEERLRGVEYAVNGQMDHRGSARVLHVMRYERRDTSVAQNMYHRTWSVPKTDPSFAAIAAYVTSVMEASELRRSPFHAEIMLTAAGPRLIEVGARLGGSDYAYFTNLVHGGQFDAFDLAAHYYISTAPYTGAVPNWTTYNATSAVHIDGFNERRQIVSHVVGTEQIETLPEFKRWVVKPRVGSLLPRTRDLLTVPFAFQLASEQGDARLAEIAAQAEAGLRINKGSSTQQLVAAHARNRFGRALQRGKYAFDTWLHRLPRLPMELLRH